MPRQFSRYSNRGYYGQVAAGYEPIFYLHGFASGPQSRKARFFAEKLAAAGHSMQALDLAEGDFAGLTLTGQLAVIDKAAAGKPVCLIGSSMGAYLAAIYAQQHPEVTRLVLLAPAFAFCDLWQLELGPKKMAGWREKGTIPVFHYGEGCRMDLRYSFLEDAQGYHPYPAFQQPCLLFHGTQDSVVPLHVAETFAQQRPNVSLRRLASGHELTDVLDEIWKESKPFLLNETYDR